MEKAPPVTILGKTYEALADGVYDAIFLGTGLKECILAGLLSVKGWKVLVLDRNDYYGGDCASLSLDSLFHLIKNTDLTDADTKRLGRSRDYNIDLVPKFIMSCGSLVKMLYTTKVTRYLEFKVVEGSYVYSGEKNAVHKVPSNTKEAVTTPLVGFFQKKKLQNFLKFVSESAVPGDDGVAEGTKVPSDSFTMNDMYKKFDLDNMAQDFIGHAMALHLNDEYKALPATDTFKAIKLYGYSVEKYGSSPYIYPVYGLGGLPEGFSRLCAVHGGVFMLDHKPEEILYNPEGHAVGVRIGGEAASAKLIIGDPSYFPEERTVSKGKVIRSICIMNHPIKNTNNAKSAQIIIPSNQVSVAGFKPRRNDIYISCASFDHNVAPTNFWIAIVSTKVETSDPKSEIACGIKILDDILERIDIISDYKESAVPGKTDSCYITSSYDATSHFETTADDVLAMYKEITGEEVDLTITPTDDDE